MNLRKIIALLLAASLGVDPAGRLSDICILTSELGVGVRSDWRSDPNAEALAPRAVPFMASYTVLEKVGLCQNGAKEQSRSRNGNGTGVPRGFDDLMRRYHSLRASGVDVRGSKLEDELIRMQQHMIDIFISESLRKASRRPEDMVLSTVYGAVLNAIRGFDPTNGSSFYNFARVAVQRKIISLILPRMADADLSLNDPLTSDPDSNERMDFISAADSPAEEAVSWNILLPRIRPLFLELERNEALIWWHLEGWSIPLSAARLEPTEWPVYFSKLGVGNPEGGSYTVQDIRRLRRKAHEKIQVYLNRLKGEDDDMWNLTPSQWHRLLTEVFQESLVERSPLVFGSYEEFVQAYADGKLFLPQQPGKVYTDPLKGVCLLPDLFKRAEVETGSALENLYRLRHRLGWVIAEGLVSIRLPTRDGRTLPVSTVSEKSLCRAIKTVPGLRSSFRVAPQGASLSATKYFALAVAIRGSSAELYRGGEGLQKLSEEYGIAAQTIRILFAVERNTLDWDDREAIALKKAEAFPFQKIQRALERHPERYSGPEGLRRLTQRYKEAKLVRDHFPPEFIEAHGWNLTTFTPAEIVGYDDLARTYAAGQLRITEDATVVFHDSELGNVSLSKLFDRSQIEKEDPMENSYRLRQRLAWAIRHGLIIIKTPVKGPYTYRAVVKVHAYPLYTALQTIPGMTSRFRRGTLETDKYFEILANLKANPQAYKGKRGLETLAAENRLDEKTIRMNFTRFMEPLEWGNQWGRESSEEGIKPVRIQSYEHLVQWLEDTDAGKQKWLNNPITVDDPWLGEPVTIQPFAWQIYVGNEGLYRLAADLSLLAQRGYLELNGEYFRGAAHISEIGLLNALSRSRVEAQGYTQRGGLGFAKYLEGLKLLKTGKFNRPDGREALAKVLGVSLRSVVQTFGRKYSLAYGWDSYSPNQTAETKTVSVSGNGAHPVSSNGTGASFVDVVGIPLPTRDSRFVRHDPGVSIDPQNIVSGHRIRTAVKSAPHVPYTIFKNMDPIESLADHPLNGRRQDLRDTPSSHDGKEFVTYQYVNGKHRITSAFRDPHGKMTEARDIFVLEQQRYSNGMPGEMYIAGEDGTRVCEGEFWQSPAVSPDGKQLLLFVKYSEYGNAVLAFDRNPWTRQIDYQSKRPILWDGITLPGLGQPLHLAGIPTIAQDQFLVMTRGHQIVAIPRNPLSGDVADDPAEIILEDGYELEGKKISLSNRMDARCTVSSDGRRLAFLGIADGKPVLASVARDPATGRIAANFHRELQRGRILAVKGSRIKGAGDRTWDIGLWAPNYFPSEEPGVYKLMLLTLNETDYEDRGSSGPYGLRCENVVVVEEPAEMAFQPRPPSPRSRSPRSLRPGGLFIPGNLRIHGDLERGLDAISLGMMAGTRTAKSHDKILQQGRRGAARKIASRDASRDEMASFEDVIRAFRDVYGSLLRDEPDLITNDYKNECQKAIRLGWHLFRAGHLKEVLVDGKWVPTTPAHVAQLERLYADMVDSINWAFRRYTIIAPAAGDIVAVLNYAEARARTSARRVHRRRNFRAYRRANQPLGMMAGRSSQPQSKPGRSPRQGKLLGAG